MHEGPEALEVVDGLSLEDQALIEAATPLLHALHRDRGIIEIEESFGEDAPFPVDSFSLKPFYMNVYDPPGVGVWAVRVNELQGRITSIANDGGQYRIDIRGEKGSRPATELEGTMIAQTLLYANNKWIEQGGLEDSAAKRQARAGGLLSRLLRRQ